MIWQPRIEDFSITIKGLSRNDYIFRDEAGEVDYSRKMPNIALYKKIKLDELKRQHKMKQLRDTFLRNTIRDMKIGSSYTHQRTF